MLIMKKKESNLELNIFFADHANSGSRATILLVGGNAISISLRRRTSLHQVMTIFTQNNSFWALSISVILHFR